MIKLINSLRGLPDEDIESWLDKLESLEKAFDAKKEETISQMPAMLEGAAYESWAALSDEDRKDYEKVAAQLRRSFGITRITAWSRLKKLQYNPGQNIETLTNSARRLLKICNNGQAATEEMLTLFVLDALPESLSITVKSRFGNNVSLRDIIEVTNTCDIDTLRSNQDELAGVRPTPKCYKFQKKGHLARNCRNDPCNICKKLGHHESTCWFKVKGNESAEL